jgi:tetratricopeptide (TPR) repeat protein
LEVSIPPALAQLLKEQRFDEATALAERALREAAAESPERLTQVAREIVAWRGIFANAAEEAASEPYFRAVHGTLAELAGPDSPAAMAAAENLAGILGALGQLDQAIALREKVFDHARTRFPADDTRVMQLRDGLAFLYRRAGHESKVAELFADVGLCEHLASAERYILGQGAKVVACCRPWSQNCHIWVYFDVLLDCERLIAGLRLDPCVTIHDHRGTHDGSERGLVCTIHHDALVGPHPSDAPP